MEAMSGHRLICAKCDHEWWPRIFTPDRKPVQCPRCKTYKWEKA